VKDIEELRASMDPLLRLLDTVACPGPLYGTVEPAEMGILMTQRVGRRLYVSVWVNFEGRWRWTLHQGSRLVASGSAAGTTPAHVDELILRDAGIFRVAWAWLTDRRKGWRLRAAIRSLRGLSYFSARPQHICEVFSSPSPMFEWCIRDRAGNVVVSGEGADQKTALKAMFEAHDQLEKRA